MDFKYNVQREDFLNFQLFQISQTEEFQSKMSRQRMTISLFLIALAVYLGVEKMYLFSGIAVVLAGLWFFLLPQRMKRLYKTKYDAEIGDKFVKRFGVEATLSVTDTTIRTADSGGYAEKRWAEVAKIVHLSSMTLVIFQDKNTFILPQATTENYHHLIQFMDKRGNELNKEIIDKTGWKW